MGDPRTDDESRPPTAREVDETEPNELSGDTPTDVESVVGRTRRSRADHFGDPELERVGREQEEQPDAVTPSQLDADEDRSADES
jgi:hypothetical protein